MSPTWPKQQFNQFSTQYWPVRRKQVYHDISCVHSWRALWTSLHMDYIYPFDWDEKKNRLFTSWNSDQRLYTGRTMGFKINKLFLTPTNGGIWILGVISVGVVSSYPLEIWSNWNCQKISTNFTTEQLQYLTTSSRYWTTIYFKHWKPMNPRISSYIPAIVFETSPSSPQGRQVATWATPASSYRPNMVISMGMSSNMVISMRI